MGERIVWISLLVLASLLTLSKVFYYFFTDNDTLYSTYRNEIDRSPKDFRRRLLRVRILWSAGAVISTGLALRLIFY